LLQQNGCCNISNPIINDQKVLIPYAPAINHPLQIAAATRNPKPETRNFFQIVLVVFSIFPVLLDVKGKCNMEKPEHIWFLLSRNLSGEATSEEKEAFMEALQQQPALMQQYELLQRLWKPNTTANTDDVKARINHILERSAREEAEQQAAQRPTAKVFRSFKMVRWAAAIAGISLAVWSFWLLNDQSPKEANEIVAKKGSKTRTLLPDGSTVWLNAGSSIVYDPEFSGNTREVTLQGEAYFDIVKQPHKPFIVHAGDINIKVLGTAFNVKSYAEESTVETTLLRGMVQISRAAAGKKEPIYLHPNEKIVLLKTGVGDAEQPGKEIKEQKAMLDGKEAIVHLDSNLKENERFETAWIYNRLEFRGDNFEELARKLERWYNITIHFEDEQVRKLEFNGSLESETIEQAFQALTAAASFRFEIKGNEIYIRSSKTT
jgi:transmembrane sensor